MLMRYLPQDLLGTVLFFPSVWLLYKIIEAIPNLRKTFRKQRIRRQDEYHTKLFQSFLLGMRRTRDTSGQDVAEYAVMLALILVLVVGTVQLIGGNANNVFSAVASQMTPQ
jgi:Flp pilus assembly pilin Flp